MTNQLATIQFPLAIQNQDATALYEKIKSDTLSSVTRKSALTYGHTLKAWEAFCEENDLLPLAWFKENVQLFLIMRDVTKATRQRDLTTMRRLAEIALDQFYADEMIERVLEKMARQLKRLKVPTENIGGQERSKKALNVLEIHTVLGAWDDHTKAVAVRNRAMLGVMFFAGMRRAEIASMEWNHIDFDNGVIRVPHGKGDKERTIAVVPSDTFDTLKVLQAWQQVQTDLDSTRKFVFCGMRKGGNLNSDKPMHVRGINTVITKTIEMTGIEFKPHDARRTLGTELIANGNAVNDVQAQLGHAHASTTLQHYAVPADARKLRSKLRVKY